MKKPRSTGRGLFLGVSGGVSFTAISIVVSLLQFRLLLRFLPLASAGVWMIFLNLGNYILLLDLGLSPTFGREISFSAGDPHASDQTKQQRIATLVRSCTITVSGLALLTAIVGSFAGLHYLRTVVPPGMQGGLRRSWSIFAVGASLNLVGEGWFAGIYGLGHIFEEKIARASGVLLGLLFFAVALWCGGGFLALASAFVLQAVCTLLIARFTLHHIVGIDSTKHRVDFLTIRRLLWPSLKYAATVLGGILILQTDNLVIASIFGPSDVPNYQAVSKIVTLLMTLSMMLITTSTPTISQAHARGDTPAIINLLSRNLRFSLAMMVTLGSFVACFSDRLIAVWIGPGHFVGFPIVWVLLGVMLLEAHHLSMASAIMATGRIVFLTPALIAGCLNLFFSVLLAHRIGLLGVACGTMAAQVLTNNWFVPWYTMRTFQMPFLPHLKHVLLPISGLLLLTLSAGYLVRTHTEHTRPLLALLLGAAATILSGGAASLLFIFRRAERHFVLNKLAVSFGRARVLPASLLE